MFLRAPYHLEHVQDVRAAAQCEQRKRERCRACEYEQSAWRSANRHILNSLYLGIEETYTFCGFKVTPLDGHLEIAGKDKDGLHDAATLTVTSSHSRSASILRAFFSTAVTSP